MKATFLTPFLLIVLASPAMAEVATIHFNGTPTEIGRQWGEINREAILSDIDVYFLEHAAERGISLETLIRQSAAFVRIAREVAPHWLAEARAVARAAGVDEDLYIAFIGTVYRDLFLHECTSYAVSRQYTKDKAIFFHKNRDNAEKAQAAFVMNAQTPGVNRFIAISDASVISCMMMVNEKGLAGSADYPGGIKPEAAEKKYRGVMHTFLLRHVAERAASCDEALKIIRDFVAKGYYAGGRVDATHWLFVDRQGTILEVSNNAAHVAWQTHTADKVYFSMREKSAAANRLRAAAAPIDFNLFHGVSRDPSICLKSSVSGMTVEIDPDRPDLLTCAWISLPAHSVSFPLFMGQRATPLPLVNGEAYRLGKGTKDRRTLWETTDGTLHRNKELLRAAVAREPSGDNLSAGRRLEQWGNQQAAMLLDVLQAVPPDTPVARGP